MRELAQKLRADISQLDRNAVFALVYAAGGLLCISYLKSPDYFAAITRHSPFAAIGHEAANPTNNNLYGLIWWVFVSVTFYFVIPALFVKFIQKRKLSEIGLAFAIEKGFVKLLLQCIAIMLPLVYLMSLTSGFMNKYPFLHAYDGSRYLSSTLLVWELVYFLQFFGLEFFSAAFWCTA